MPAVWFRSTIYQTLTKNYEIENLGVVAGKCLKLQSLLVTDANLGPKYAADQQKNVAKWVSEGTFKA